ncbi:hypothetical protein L228DRAFT_266743 [Xylona heveae TC161]|uniref:Dienelactone hydrolase domain-containing protein n=1 Tax=Xylona heveae (strain CBS 132557 / TC161) TaxID=1328760 RepID=A0A165I562_XYLHT|nr:hypothetical protein L228DRAFT_266743 [Xylona heveae TC161]KZF24400.1 hypothetical protein L228DRAFT_266743 [Xylona heveae TC161]
MSCPDCFRGSVHEGTPKGQVTKVHGLDAYVAEPTSGAPVKGIIVILPDAFGWEFVNLRLLADGYAETGGYKVYLPEFMDGYAAPISAVDVMRKAFNNGSWTDTLLKPYYFAKMLYLMIPFMLANTFSKTWPPVKSFFESIRENEGANLPVGAAGFCWGGKHTVVLAHGYEASNGKPLIDAGFTAHPSNLVLPTEIEQMKKPVSFALGDKDIVIKAPQIEQIKQIVEKQSEEAKGEVKVYYGASHGFGVRADLVLLDAQKQANECQEQALHWFNSQFQGLY